MADREEIDMTPMVDVTFLLLIFFMVTAAFRLQKSIEVPLADQDESAARQTIEDFSEDSITIRVDGDNVYWVGSPDWSEEKEAPNIFDMLAGLREAKQGNGEGGGSPPIRLLVLASEDATHEKVVAALDAGSEVGMEEIQLATLRDDEP